jgi:hypothetical protein
MRRLRFRVGFRWGAFSWVSVVGVSLSIVAAFRCGLGATIQSKMPL